MKKHNIKAPVILALLTLILFAGLEYAQLKWEDKDPAKSTRAQYSENLENNLGGAYTESTAAGTMTEEERAEMRAAFGTGTTVVPLMPLRKKKRRLKLPPGPPKKTQHRMVTVIQKIPRIPRNLRMLKKQIRKMLKIPQTKINPQRMKLR